MQKSDLVDLIKSYHGEVTYEPLITQAPYRKEWIKRLFNTQSQGIAELQAFLQSTPISQLGLEDEIEGQNLLKLLKIIYNRERRIFGTPSSYENAPNYSTNQVYERLYQLLLFDADIQAGLDLPHANTLNGVLFQHIRHRVITDLENRAQRIFKKYEHPQKANSGYLDLGLSLLFGKEIEHSFRSQAIEEQFTSQTSILKCSYGSVEVKFIFLNQALHAATFVSAKIQYQSISAGLKWLKLASSNGDKEASLHLAAYYARRKDYRSINKKTDQQQAFTYLNLARNQGSELAKKVLLEKRSFGNLSFGDENHSYEPRCF